jgi:pyridoxal phosphate enzyme (YggS family)
MDGLRDNLGKVRGRIAAAAARAGRGPEEVLLLAVSKTFPPPAIQVALDAGLAHFGENRVQEARDKAPLLPPGITWHLVGHLQANKARYCPGLFAYVHTLDSADLARELGKRYRAAGQTCRVLVQVNVGGEEQKSGCEPERAGEVLAAALAEGVVAPGGEGGLAPCGLMCLPPHTDDPEGARPYFRELRELRDRLRAAGFPAESLKELSMGMSHDLEVAVEEGATIVRVGSALFGERGNAGH